MAKKEGAIPFRTDNNGIAYHYPEGSNYSNLFIITPEPKLIEFEKYISGCLQKHGLLDCAAADRIAQNCSVELLELAEEEIGHKWVIRQKSYQDGYINGLHDGKAEALKDLPR